MKVKLVSARALFRECLKNLMVADGYTVSVMASIEELEDEIAEPAMAGIVVLDGDSLEHELPHTLTTVKVKAPNARLVVLKSQINLSFMVSIFSVGADGLISSDTAPDLFLQNLKELANGQRIFPEYMISQMTGQGQYFASRPQNAAQPLPRGLSEREVEILKLLALGESNKRIARRFDIAETTVKTHLKSILRKLRVNNRTQAAIWAMSKGLTTTLVHPGTFPGEVEPRHQDTISAKVPAGL